MIQRNRPNGQGGSDAYLSHGELRRVLFAKYIALMIDIADVEQLYRDAQFVAILDMWLAIVEIAKLSRKGNVPGVIETSVSTN